MKEIVAGIYKITNPEGKVYIGQSVDCYNRERQYANGETESQPKLHASVIKFGWDKHIFKLIESCNSHDKLNKRERYHITFFDSIRTGLNTHYGKKKNKEKFQPEYREVDVEIVGVLKGTFGSVPVHHIRDGKYYVRVL